MSLKIKVFVTISVSAIIFFSLVLAYFYEIGTKDDDPGRMDYPIGPNGRMVIPRIDHSIFKGLDFDGVFERISRVLGHPELESKMTYYDYYFEKEVRYQFEDETSFHLRISYQDGIPYSHFISISFPPEGSNLTNSIPKGIPYQSMNFLDRFLFSFDEINTNKFTVTYEREEINSVHWIVSIYQKWGNETFLDPGVVIVVQNDTGLMTSFRCFNWLFQDQIQKINRFDRNFTDAVYQNLSDIDHKIKVPFEVDLIDDKVIWSDYYHLPINGSKIISEGFVAIMGRVCEKIIVNYSIRGNFSHLYSSRYSSERSVVYFNGSNRFQLGWFFDIETGKILKWCREYHRSKMGRNYYSNLGDNNIIWSEDYKDGIP